MRFNRTVIPTIVVSSLLAACGDSTSEPAASTQADAQQAVAPAPAAAKHTESERIAAMEARVQHNPLKNAYFGETHVHTGVSMDAFIGGNRLKPDDAYRFAKGEEVMVNGSPHRISKPLDFCAITDHSEFMGESYSLMNPGAPGYDDPVAVSFRNAKDPDGPNLDRIQIIKGWLEDGEMMDTVYNAVASGDRLHDDGSVEPIEAPVDLETGQFNTEKGSPVLSGTWTDPDFDPAQEAYYYVRVLQLPTARWSLYDEIRYGVRYPDDVKREIVERAWGSPIWYEVN